MMKPDFRAGGEPHRENIPMQARLASVTSANADTRTVTLEWTTGADVIRYDWWEGTRYIERLQVDTSSCHLDRLNGGAPLLNSHATYDLADQIGVVERAWIATGSGFAEVRFPKSGVDANADRVFSMVQDGIIRNVSVGYSVSRYEIQKNNGNGLDVWTAVDWTPLELSLVTVPADAGAGVRAADSKRQHVCEFVVRDVPAATKESKMDEDTVLNPGSAAPAVANNTPVTRTIPPANPSPNPAVEVVAVVDRFDSTATLAFLDNARSLGVEEQARELIASNSRGELGQQAARDALLRAAAERQAGNTAHVSGGHIAITADAHDKWMRGAANSIIQRAGIGGVLMAAAKLSGDNIDLNPGEFRGVRCVDLARMALDNMSVRVDSLNPDRIVELAFTSRSAANGVSDFTVLLESVLHKVLSAGYTITPDTWSRFCGKGSLVDFRPHPRYIRGTFGVLDSLTEQGEFKNKSIPDGAKESITGKTKGNIVSLTRQAIKNDDLSAFSTVTLDLARAAKLTIESDVYSLFALNGGYGPTMNDGYALFNAANHFNVAATASIPAVAAFDAMRVQMAQQKDLSGNEFLDVRPAVWLGPLGLGGSARVINGATYDPDTANKLQKPNAVKDMFSDIVDTPRLSGTAWFGFADPLTNPAIEVAFLDGIQEPYLEERDGWRSDGSEWKVRLDYGVGGVNWRAAAMNAGQ